MQFYYATCVTGRGCIGARTVQWSWQGAWLCADQDPRCACWRWHEASWLEIATCPVRSTYKVICYYLACQRACLYTYFHVFYLLCPNFVCSAHADFEHRHAHHITRIQYHLWVYACLIHSNTINTNVVHVPLPTSDPGMDPGRVLTASDPPLSTGALISNRWRGDRRLVLKNAAGHSLADVEVSIQGLRSLALVT